MNDVTQEQTVLPTTSTVVSIITNDENTFRWGLSGGRMDDEFSLPKWVVVDHIVGVDQLYAGDTFLVIESNRPRYQEGFVGVIMKLTLQEGAGFSFDDVSDEVSDAIGALTLAGYNQILKARVEGEQA